MKPITRKNMHTNSRAVILIVLTLFIPAFALMNSGCKKSQEKKGGEKRAANSAPGGQQPAAAQSVPGTASVKCPAGMAAIPAGTFSMGCASGDTQCRADETRHEIRITRPFCMDVHEVTQAEYQKSAGANPSFFKTCGDNCPVEQVSWNDAHAYCAKQGKSLPTEAEWEYSARAGSDTKYYWGEMVNGDYAWYASNSIATTHHVANKQPNPFGLYDMLGNVWEWTSDFYGNYPSQLQTDPTGPASGEFRVLRGGGINNNERLLRASHRDRAKPDVENRFIGFRCAKNAG